MRKISKLILLAVPALLCVPECANASEKAFLNDTEIRFFEDESGNIMFPMRELFETAGFTVQWFEDSGRAAAFNDDLNITVTNDTNIVYINRIGYFLSDTIGIIDDEFLVSSEMVELVLDADIEELDGAVYITSSAVRSSDTWQYEVFDLLNQIRSENGLPEFIWNADLEILAKEHGEDMINRNYFSHITPDGLDPFMRMENSGLSFRYAAENIAAGQPTPEQAVKAWLESDGHRENILNPELEECAVAVVRGGKYGIYWINEFLTY